jgi:N-acetylmuramoyl-L-alanine amidase
LAALIPFVPVQAEPGIAPGSAVVIAAGQPVLVRVNPGWDAAVAYELADGSPVTVWDAEQTAPDGSLWYPVDGGFVPADAVTSVAVGGMSPAPADAGASPTDATEDSGSGNGALTAPVAAAPDAAATNDGTAGASGVVPGTEADPVDNNAPVMTEPLGQPIGSATVANTGGQGAACRAAPDVSSPALAVFGDGNQVDLRGGDVGGWTPVNCAGAGGYVASSLLTWDTAASPPVPPAAAGVPDVPKIKDSPVVASTTAAPAGQDTGMEIADFALQYQGYPYIYAGEGPWAFDCSGFTMFVINQTLGLNVPHDMTKQFGMGQPVDRNALQPGDLVFFANTDHPGMSHNGIYIGGGKFVHAENEGVGVKVSELADDYYSSRWYGAVRYTPGTPTP